MSVHIGGFWFPYEAFDDLFMKAYDIPDITAPIYFDDCDYLDFPTLIGHDVRDKSGELASGWVLACRLAFVDPGLEVPDLSIDQSTRACADHWFPPWLRGLEDFKKVRYIQYEHNGYIPIPFIESKERECGMPQQKCCPDMPKRLQKRHEWGRTFTYVPPSVHALYVYDDDDDDDDDDDSANTSDSDFAQPSGGTPSPWASVQHPRRGVGRTSN
ncbi:uncharacterized protein BXZ73DRAFT_107765 [Epithele typhae]|uniref:uncharacterized protein n=1 Tax=Epithele typhae TaxID=378194 RepID=UPI0020080E98|nr:uncharacterized protein BXZ73DRAFT_107765 [Epithele typhae]KAH9911933.1 hypothetical protein BXZ73DRAFT_107765 [Epithele typhae]